MCTKRAISLLLFEVATVVESRGDDSSVALSLSLSRSLSKSAQEQRVNGRAPAGQSSTRWRTCHRQGLSVGAQVGYQGRREERAQAVALEASSMGGFVVTATQPTRHDLCRHSSAADEAAKAGEHSGLLLDEELHTERVPGGGGR
ncbi:hypothetical protein L7F22_050457 [Adiantum nelumboides]|nr:hypothetical protein [Adiantum nelumboides]